MSPSEAGARAEAAVLAALVSAGKRVLLPFAAHHRYDLVVEDDLGFHRVQCKTGRLRAGAVRFRTHSTTGRRLAGYDGEVDYFGVYCPDNGEVYLVPAAALPERGACLRVSPPANGQRDGIRWAERYVVPSRRMAGAAPG